MPELAVLALVATGLAVGAVSAVWPFLPVEAYVASVALAQPPPVALAVAAGAAVGQTIGKTVIFTSARAAGRSRWLGRLRDRTGHQADVVDGTVDDAGAVDDRTREPGPGRRTAARAGRWLRRLNATVLRLLGGRAGSLVVLLSATLGLPPLLVVSFYAGASPMTYRTFVPTCLLGRTSRLCAIALIPGLVRG